jgi:hypothetical protein
MHAALSEFSVLAIRNVQVIFFYKFTWLSIFNSKTVTVTCIKWPYIIETLQSGLADVLHEVSKQNCPAPESAFQISRVTFVRTAPSQNGWTKALTILIGYGGSLTACIGIALHDH